MRGLLLGRFQPFHKGHLKIIKKISGEVDWLNIAVGSSQHSHSRENPFSAKERIEMIDLNLAAAAIKDVTLYCVPDINNDKQYPGHVMKIIPQFDVVYSGNNLVQRLFREAGKDVRIIKHIRRKAYSGSEIRRRMIKGDRWKHLVPKETLNYLRDIKGVERIKKLK